MQKIFDWFKPNSLRDLMAKFCVVSAIVLIIADAWFTSIYIGTWNWGVIDLKLFKMGTSFVFGLFIAIISCVIGFIWRDAVSVENSMSFGSKSQNEWINKITGGAGAIIFFGFVGFIYLFDISSTYSAMPIPASEQIPYLADWTQSILGFSIRISTRAVGTFMVVFGNDVLLILSGLIAGGAASSGGGGGGAPSRPGR